VAGRVVAVVGAAAWATEANNSTSGNRVALRMRGFSESAHTIAARVPAAIIIAIIVTSLAATPAQGQLIFACTPDNDLFNLVPGAKRTETPAEAIKAATEGSGVLILADGYPQRRVELPPDLVQRGKEKRLRLYVEYPSNDHKPRAAAWERGVVASDLFGDALPSSASSRLTRARSSRCRTWRKRT
jgi:hypothetical protein